MRNRAKCRKCGSVIESFHPTDFILCKCEEIAVDGGEALRCYARDWGNFLRVDDEGNEIVPTIRNIDNPSDEEPHYNDNSEALEALKLMIDSYLKLPQEVMMHPATNADFCNVMMIVYQALRGKNEEKKDQQS